MDAEQELIPIEQQTLIFYEKPIVVVRLPDGRPGVVIRFLCENLQIDTAAQVARIRRTEAIADGLVQVQVQTDGGLQNMSALVLRAVPFWLAGIDSKRVREEIRPEILRYQREVVDVLYTWAQQSSVKPTAVVPTEQMTRPATPSDNATLDVWREYHRQMIIWIDWQRDIEQWRSEVDSHLEDVERRLEGVEAITGLIPKTLERLEPQTLTLPQQKILQGYVKQLHEASRRQYPAIYEDVKIAFQVSRYQDISEEQWPQVEKWFLLQIERARKR